MNIKTWRLIWLGSPLTKVVYAFLAYREGKEINNSFEMISVALMIFGIICSVLSIALAKNMYKKDFYEKKIVKAFVQRQIKGEDISPIFFLFTTALGLSECAALYGFVQYLLTGNLLAGCILFACCFIAWAFNYPSGIEDDE